MEQWHYQTLDVFTDRPLEGNPLAVFADAAAIPERLLQRLAREINFSETVFLYPAAAGGDARMRIFTPMNEVPFAGHPTLGTAVLVARRLGKPEVVLETGSGPVPVRVELGDGPATRGTMRQPIPTIAPIDDPEPLLAALGVARSVLPVTLYNNGLPHVYAVLERPEQVVALRPDASALIEVTRQLGYPTIGINASAGEGRAWKTRMFAPADGVFEDPATGSAAGPLALHLARHGLVPSETEITISQGAEIGRPSTLFAKVSQDGDQITSVEVGGYAVPVGGGWFDAGVIGDG